MPLSRQITRRIEFDAAHRVLGHESKCAHLHGHRYAAEITVEAPNLDTLGRVIDFGVIKEKVGGWIDKNWDHNALFNTRDPIVSALNDSTEKPFYLFPGCNPTAENIATDLLSIASTLLQGDGLVVTQVRIYETPNCWADARQ